MSTAATVAVAALPIDANRGRNRISTKAITRVTAAVTADAFGVSASRVGVELGDDHGALVITVTTPIRVVSLTRVQRDPGSVSRAGGSVLDRAAAAQQTIGSRVSELTGSTIGRVTVRLTSVTIQDEGRVQ